MLLCYRNAGKGLYFETVKELEVYKMNQIARRITKVIIQVTINSENIITFSKENKILRKVYPCELQTNIDTFQNIEQIQNLEQLGEQGPTKRKSSKWIATWKGKKIVGIGGYYQDEQKTGLWTLPIKNYWSQAKVYESGEYFEDQKRGRWNYIYKNKIIGGGSYDEKGNGIKIGKWVELVEGFYKSQQVIYNGEYKNGNKVGVWELYCKNWFNPKIQAKGVGSYDEIGNGIKIGKWVEADEELFEGKQVIHNGEYKNGQKVGAWDIYYDNKKIGGGLYDERGSGIKIGKWIELNQGFFSKSQVIHAGEYKNGNKIGIWDINYTNCFDSTIEEIGGGSYDDIGNGIKIGKWVELDEEFYEDKQVIYNGEYKNGKKVGNWDMKFRAVLLRQFRIFGGESYKRGDNVKIGNWIELDEEFSEDNQIIHKGQYENGKQVGRWDIEYRIDWRNQFSKMQKYNIKYVTNHLFKICVSGGGIFEESEKQGNWEIPNKIHRSYFIKNNGQYKDDKKVGRWDTWLINDGNNARIGGGLYDGFGKEIKLGYWSEILEKGLDIIQKNGEYNDGKKDGLWIKMVRFIHDMEGKFKKRKEIIYWN